MLFFPCIYTPEQHEIIRSDIVDWCKRQSKAPAEKKRWFLYRHRIHGTFVIARWAGEPFGIFSDFLNLGNSLSNFNEEMVEEFLRRLHAPVSAEDIRKVANQTHQDYQSTISDKNEQMKEIRRRYGGNKAVWG